MAETILAGDIGATKTNLAVFETAGARGGRPALVREERYLSNDYHDLESLIATFLGDEAPEIAAAVFGMAGPVFEGRASGVNFPWTVDEASLRRALGTHRVRIMNDLETTAHGTLVVEASDRQTIQEGTARNGNRAVIAAGTGLGQGFLYWDGTRHHPSATEGGHTDFGPRNEVEWGLLQFLLKRYPRVSYERIVSGPGLHNIFCYLTEVLGRPVEKSVAKRLLAEDPNAVVGEAGVAATCRTCEEAVEMFVSLYGAQAGNLALTVMATGGVYVGGGIVTKMLSKVTSGIFVRGFTDKGRYTGIMREIPVHVLLNPKTALLGAARAAADLLTN